MQILLPFYFLSRHPSSFGLVHYPSDTVFILLFFLDLGNIALCTLSSVDHWKDCVFLLTLCSPDIVDIKPANMEELTEVITAAEFHPHQCNTFVYSSSKGTIRLCDMRASALCDKHSKCEHLLQSLLITISLPRQVLNFLHLATRLSLNYSLSHTIPLESTAV